MRLAFPVQPPHTRTHTHTHAHTRTQHTTHALFIHAQLTTAIVGRTGAGKSSLSVALLRLAELSGGTIAIDGVDLSTVGLPLLRRSITFIQQEPLLFGGTIRSNLDPLEQHPDHHLEAVLREVYFVRLSGNGAKGPSGGGGGNSIGCGGDGSGGGGGTSGTVGDTLQMEVAEGGGNLSAGLRQLLMLARAMLRRSPVLLMDEATANCDFVTDAVIQRVIRSHFAAATILTIAHRLETIIDYDLLLLLANGRVAEAGEPATLLDDPQSGFSALVAEAGKQAAGRLREAARDAQRTRATAGAHRS